MKKEIKKFDWKSFLFFSAFNGNEHCCLFSKRAVQKNTAGGKTEFIH